MASSNTFLTRETTTLILGAGVLFLLYKSDVFGKISSGGASAIENIGQGIGNIGGGIGAIGYGIGGGVENLGTGIGGGVFSLGAGIGKGVEDVGIGIGSIGVGFGNLQTQLGTGFQNLLTQVGGIGASFNKSAYGDTSIKIGSGANTPESALTDGKNDILDKATTPQAKNTPAAQQVTFTSGITKVGKFNPLRVLPQFAYVATPKVPYKDIEGTIHL